VFRGIQSEIPVHALKISAPEMNNRAQNYAYKVAINIKFIH
jgi:hypothetical protein